MRAAKVDNGRGAACQELAHEVPVDRVGKLDVRKLGLQREGALEKPTVKRLVKRDARLWPLARMHVQVNKPGKSIASRPQLYKDAGLPVGACRTSAAMPPTSRLLPWWPQSNGLERMRQRDCPLVSSVQSLRPTFCRRGDNSPCNVLWKWCN